MLFRRSIRHLISLPLSAAAVAVSASSLFAQGRPLFQWSGRVDREVRITMRGRDARTQMADRSPFPSQRLNVETALPQRDGRVTVRVQDGRGDVDVVQQPSARNDYTAIVRVRDRSSGTDNYRFTAYWMPDEYGNGTWGDRDGYPNRPGRDHDDRDNGNWGRDNGGWGGNGGYGRGYDRNLVRWTGDVDDALEIRIQGNRIDYRTLSGKSVKHVRANFANGGLPRTDAQVFVTDQTGRGSVSVVQQPSSWNNYTAVIRVYDPRPGYGTYSFDLGWRGGYSSRR
ncbi:MAG TPA: hypothetical protein VFW03_12320 [Gemmatimonadaceae bacterium]|nr:hypothetical protein [Gemmatimonadaceae bacterium]